MRAALLIVSVLVACGGHDDPPPRPHHDPPALAASGRKPALPPPLAFDMTRAQVHAALPAAIDAADGSVTLRAGRDAWTFELDGDRLIRARATITSDEDLGLRDAWGSPRELLFSGQDVEEWRSTDAHVRAYTIRHAREPTRALVIDRFVTDEDLLAALRTPPTAPDGTTTLHLPPYGDAFDGRASVVTLTYADGKLWRATIAISTAEEGPPEAGRDPRSALTVPLEAAFDEVDVDEDVHRWSATLSGPHPPRR